MKRVYGVLKSGDFTYKLDKKSTLIGRSPVSDIVIQVICMNNYRIQVYRRTTH